MTWRRFEQWLKRLNEQFAPVARWTALAGIIIGFSTGDYAVAYGFLGLLLAPSVIGKR